MNTTDWIHYISIVLSFILCGTVGVSVWRHRQSPGIRTYFYITLAQMSWILGYALELTSPSLAGKLFWDDLQFIGSMFIPLLLMIFAFEYTGQGKELSRRTRMALTAVPVLFLVLLYTNAFHGLVRTPTARIVPGEPFDALIYNFTPLMWVSFIYSYLTYLAGTVLFIRNLFRQHRLFRVQTLIILIGFVFPFLGSLPGMAGVAIFGQRDITPYTFGVGNLILAWGLFRHSLFEVTPIARDAVLEFMNDWVIVLDRQSRVVDINPAALSALEITANRAISLPIAQLLADYPDLIGLLRNDQSVRVDVTYTAPNGTNFILDTFFSPLFDQNSRFIGRLLVARDITQRRQAEAALRQAHDELDVRVQERTAELYAANVALRESESRFRSFVEQTTDGIVFFNSQGQVVEWNKAWERLTGFKRQAALGMNVWDVQMRFTPDDERQRLDRAKLQLRVQKILESGVLPAALQGPHEARIQHVDGSLRVVEQRLFPIEALQGIALGIVFQDITERKRAEVEREQLIRDLEARNAELERFAYTVSHDLKTPLVTIKNFLGFLEQDALAGDVERLHSDMGHISAAADKMLHLLNDLIEITRIDRFSTPPERLSASILAGEAAATVAGLLNQRAVQVEIAPDMPAVFGDRTRLREIWENLIGNAAKFMGDQSRPRIAVGASKREGETVFYVRDNGIGIEPRYQDQVFRLFEKLDPNSEGTGIGLTLVKRIVETHGGKIWIESDGTGCGSTFCFTLHGVM